MDVRVFESKADLGRAAASHGAELIRKAQRAHAGRGVNVVVATGASQFEMLAELVKAPNIAWNRVTVFHLDEYVGLPGGITHPASFRKYLWERFHSKLPLPLAAFNYIDADADAADECHGLGEGIRRHPIDVAFIGIGENGHVAFNDPPADFETEEPYLVVNLDEACRRQQLGEGWFTRLEDVPQEAISMSIRQILKSGEILCIVPDARKAKAVAACLEGPVTPDHPASILQEHRRTTVYLDRASAKLLQAHA
jgi:glucosamine-6-phosphate deaminase